MSAPRRTVSALILGLALAAFGQSALAQVPAGQAPPSQAPGSSAREVREQFMAVMKRYPPELGRMLKQDGGLFYNEAYLAPYPALKAFIAQHPDVARNPGYYLESVQVNYWDRTPGQEMWRDMTSGVAVFTVVGTVLFAFIWIVRTLIDYRRWHRLSKIQAETHTKLLDRFTANDELMAYVQSPAGSHFLQSMPISLDPGTRAMSAPFGRILLSAQAGIVVAAAGMGLYYVSGKVDPELMQPLYTLGIFALFVGVGFVLSAIVSYVLSKRLGLFDPPAPALPPGRHE